MDCLPLLCPLKRNSARCTFNSPSRNNYSHESLHNSKDARRGAEAPPLWGTSSPRPNSCSCWSDQQPLDTFPEAQCGTHTAALRAPHDPSGGCRVGKSEAGPCLLQSLPSPACTWQRPLPTHPSGQDIPICRHQNSQTKPSHEHLIAGQHPKAKPFLSSPRRFLCRAGACSAHWGRAEHSCPQVWGRSSAGNQEYSYKTERTGISAHYQTS